jgi:ribosomal protein S18 acetylase RimI-like enzyme
MPQAVSIHAKEMVEAFARRNPFLHLYEIGDLDDFFWPHTTWYALQDGGQLQQLALLYTGARLPTLLAYADPPVDGMRQLLQALLPVLPRRFYAHLHAQAVDILAADYQIQPHGAHHKMGLTDPTRLAQFDTTGVVRLSPTNVDELDALYRASYPGHWFTPRMLETGYYFGIRRRTTLVSVAGVHVFSLVYRVAAIGNVTTRPDLRGHGLGTVVTARLCQELLRAGIEHIGLNVKADNRAAIGCYERLGFSWAADYGEYMLEPLR